MITTVLSSTVSALVIIGWLHPKIYKMTDIYSRWGELEKRLSEVERMVKETHYDTRPNHGGSAYDAQTRLINQILERINDGQTFNGNK